MVEIAAPFRTAIWTAAASEINGGSLEITEGGVVRATFSSITAVNSAGRVTISSSSNATVASNATAADGFVIKDSGGVVQMSGSNQAFAIAPSSQSAANDEITINAHGLSSGQLLLPSGDLATTTPQIVANFPVVASVVDANRIQILATKGGSAIAIDTVSASNLILTVFPVALGDINSSAMVKLNQTGTALVQGDSISFNSFSFDAPRFLIPQTA